MGKLSLKYIALFLGLTLSSLVFIGCDGKSDLAKHADDTYVRVTKGDPIAFVKGTSGNGETVVLQKATGSEVAVRGTNQGAIDPLLFEKGTENWVFYVTGFIEGKPDDGMSLKLATLQSKQEDSVQGSSFRSQIQGDDVHLTSNMTDIKVTLNRDEQGLLKFSNAENVYDAGTQLKVIHYSTKTDNSAFSIMVYGTAPNGLRSLVVYHFTKGTTKALTGYLSDMYEYLFDGAGYRWKTNQTIAICSMEFDGLKKVANESVELWNASLKGRLTLTAKESHQCPPFSDLNTRTMFYVEDWIEVEGASGTLGVALNTPIHSTGEFLDGDMFVFKTELEEQLPWVAKGYDINDPKLYNTVGYQHYLSRIFVHEMGHVLGLDHMFSGRESVMSYNKEHWLGYLRAYDVNAIQKLYPKK